MKSTELTLRTGSALVTDITKRVAEFVQQFEDGLLSLFLPHATAGLAVMELGSGSEADLAAAIERFLPTAAGYRHSHGTIGHGRDHVLPVFVSPSMVLPVLNGSVTLGTWQSIVVVDTNRDNPTRRLQMSFLRGGS